MKKILNMLLIISLLIGILPAGLLAANTMEEQLVVVTSKVKEQLTIGDQYSSFHGEARENGLEKYWSLTWSNEKEDHLSILTNQEGKIMSYYRRDNDPYQRYDSYFAPAFPKLEREAAIKTAQAFLDKVLDTKIESFTFENNNNYIRSENESYYFNGIIQLNSLDSPIKANINVNCKNQVISFNRNDSGIKYLGNVLSSKATISQEQAALLLKEKIKLKLEYVRDSKQKDRAVLRYLPVYNGNFMVDAKTGKIINIDELYEDITRSGANAKDETAAAENSLAGVGGENKAKLSPEEISGIEKLKDLLNKEQLDAKLRTMQELGLKDYTLVEANYRYNKEADHYTCNLSYARTLDTKEGLGINRKQAQVDAKTGKLISLYTSYPYRQELQEVKISEDVALGNAQKFLAKYYKDNYNKTKLYPDEDRRSKIGNPENNFSYNYNFVQMINGYYFPENKYNLSINSSTGAIDGFSGSFIESQFESTEGIVNMAEAIDSYYNAHEVSLSYLNLPIKIDLTSPDMRPLIEQGYSYLYELCLGYSLNSTQKPWAVNAKTGEVLYPEINQQNQLSYSDIKDKTNLILKLADYGIGFKEENFQPSKSLTQIDLLALLVSADGYLYDPTKIEDIDKLYNRAYQLGVITKDQRNDLKLINRTDLVKIILNMSGYGKVAMLPGIYTKSFIDQAEVANEDFGYITIAKGLGLVKGDHFWPKKISTRQQAAEILYNFMSR